MTSSALRWLVLSAVIFGVMTSLVAVWWPNQATGATPEQSPPQVEVTPTPAAWAPALAQASEPQPAPVPQVGPQPSIAVVPDTVAAEPQLQAWAPPTPQERVFDLNGDGRVGRDERERAEEILALANDFAANRSADGSFPILKDAFRGEPRLFQAMDGDGDGALSTREWVSFHVDSIREVRRFDQNADGAATLAEMGVAATRFDYLDFDHDGEIWAWEIDIQRGRGKW
jgi:EF hand